VPDLIALLCILSLVTVLGGGILFMLYGVGELKHMIRRYIDKK
jgi:hypothetical protein